MRDYLKKQGYHVISSEFYGFIEGWLDWYKGKVESFHMYKQYNGKKLIGRERASLGMAKKICEDWANLLLNEKVQINMDDEAISELVNKVLLENNFRVRANRMIELTYALGTGAFVEYLDDGKVIIDYIRANMIYPLAWENGEIIECAFSSEKVIGGKMYSYLNMHLLVDGNYSICNKLFEKKNGELIEVDLPESIQPLIYTNSKIPLFQIVMPNIVNNVELDNPMGLSIFANALDVLKGIDLIYDSYNNEFRLGKKRIVVPAGMAQMQSGDTGMTPIFDDNDTEFYAINDKSLTELREINMELRADPHEKALQKNLNLLSAKCGLGTVRYNYESKSSKTATEITSEKGELFQNLLKNELVLEKAIVDMVRAIAFLSGFDTDFDVTINFDDSIIEDTNMTSQRAILELQNGVIDEVEYLSRVYKLTQKQAIERVGIMKARKRQHEVELQKLLNRNN